MKRLIAGLLLVASLGSIAWAQADTEPVQPAPHISVWPSLGTGPTPSMRQASLALGPELQRGRSARQMLEERRRLDEAFAALRPHRKGEVDAYVLAVALDSDPVFGREAREAGRVLARRYGAEGRVLTLAGPDGRSAGLPRGSITSLTLALARIAELMDPGEDVLVLYSTSHGTPDGLAYHDSDYGYGILSPYRLRSILEELGIERRILLLSACYSGIFLPALASPDTAMITAASAQSMSFGCFAENDWTFFGDALVNHAMRKPLPLRQAAMQARGTIAGWESEYELDASDPQIAIGTDVNGWLTKLEGRLPRNATEPVGMPATHSIETASRIAAARRGEGVQLGR